MLLMLAIKDDSLHDFFEFHSSIPLKLRLRVGCLHFVFDIQVLFVVMKKIARYSFHQLFIRVLQREGFDDRPLEEFCSLTDDVSKILLVDELLIILLLEKGNRPFGLVVENTHDVVIIKWGAQLIKLIVGFDVFLESFDEVELLLLELVDSIVEVFVLSQDGLKFIEETIISIHYVLSEVEHFLAPVIDAETQLSLLLNEFYHFLEDILVYFVAHATLSIHFRYLFDSLLELLLFFFEMLTFRVWLSLMRSHNAPVHFHSFIQLSDSRRSHELFQTAHLVSSLFPEVEQPFKTSAKLNPYVDEPIIAFFPIRKFILVAPLMEVRAQRCIFFEVLLQKHDRMRSDYLVLVYCSTDVRQYNFPGQQMLLVFFEVEVEKVLGASDSLQFCLFYDPLFLDRLDDALIRLVFGWRFLFRRRNYRLFFRFGKR